ncbi:MAG: hypothetical protein ACPIOQ_39370 [Promethearchaeia archaeon]
MPARARAFGARVPRTGAHIQVNLKEWNQRVGIIKGFWSDLLNETSLTGLGTSLLQRVEQDESLEPLFRYSNKEVQGTKFMDMLSSIVDNLNSPEVLRRKT